MKLAMLSLVAVTTILGIVSAWDVTIYSREAKHCGKSESDGTTFKYVHYEGSGGPGPCIEAGAAPVGGMGPTNSSLNCNWFTDGGANIEPCTGPMKPTGGSIVIGDQTECDFFFSDAGSGITDRYRGGCVVLAYHLDNECRSVDETDLQIYVQCRDKA